MCGEADGRWKTTARVDSEDCRMLKRLMQNGKRVEVEQTDERVWCLAKTVRLWKRTQLQSAVAGKTAANQKEASACRQHRIQTGNQRKKESIMYIESESLNG